MLRRARDRATREETPVKFAHRLIVGPTSLLFPLSMTRNIIRVKEARQERYAREISRIDEYFIFLPFA